MVGEEELRKVLAYEVYKREKGESTMLLISSVLLLIETLGSLVSFLFSILNIIAFVVLAYMYRTKKANIDYLRNKYKFT